MPTSTSTTPSPSKTAPSQTLEPPVDFPSSVTEFSADLGGDNEVHPVDSDASGTATFSVDDGEISYDIQVSQLDDVGGAHLHNAKESSNGDVVATLPTEYPAEGIITSADLEGPLEGKSINDLVDLMKEGEIYVNLHSTTYPDGEIRGQEVILRRIFKILKSGSVNI